MMSLYVLLLFSLNSLYVGVEALDCPIDSNATLPDNDLVLFRQAFPKIVVSAPSGSPYLGHQNNTLCCIRAISDYLHNGCVNSTDVRADPQILDPNVQFPCGAAFQGTFSGAPTVEVSYNWTLTWCPGWQLPSPSSNSQWLQMLVGFLLPSVVFALNVPRGWQFVLPGRLFRRNLGWLTVPCALLAIVCATIDTIAWLCIVFIAAGPMLLSGLFEATMDHNVMKFLLRADRSLPEMPLALRARILFTLPCGNLEMSTAWKHVMTLAKDLDEFDNPQHKPWRAIAAARVREVHADDVQTHANTDDTEYVNFDIATYSPQQVLTTETKPDVDNPDDGPNNTLDGKNSESAIVNIQSRTLATRNQKFVDQAIERYVSNVRSVDERRKILSQNDDRLKSMLGCQYDFGSTIGAPIVFYIGAYLYTLFDILGSYGNSDIAHSLAFGEWWMIIVHVAVVSCLLLGGNNPNTLRATLGGADDTILEYVVGAVKPNTIEDIERDNKRQGKHPRNKWSKAKHSWLLQPVYERFMPVAMWHRGRSKQEWLLNLCADAWSSYPSPEFGPKVEHRVRRDVLELIQATVVLSWGDWLFVVASAFFLLFVPCMFAFLTAFWTPQIGLSCRSLTFLTYMISQTLLLICWCGQMTIGNEYWRHGHHIRRHNRDSILAEAGDPTVLFETLQEMGRRDSVIKTPRNAFKPVFKICYQIILVTGIVLAVVSAILGTLMQLLGLYRSCFCKVNVNRWASAAKTADLVLSTNTTQDLRMAKLHWTGLGIASIGFLSLMCFLGWYYQKRARATFVEAAKELGDCIAKRGAELEENSGVVLMQTR